MQFNVPQFEIEDKLFGPLTVIQFLYVSIALAISFFLFPVLATWFWLIISIILVGGSLMIALVKVGGRPMLIFLLAAAYYLWEPKTLMIPRPIKIVELKESLPAIFIKKDSTPSISTPSVSTPSVSTPSVSVPAENKTVVSKQDSYIDTLVAPTIKDPMPYAILEDEIKKSDSSLQNLFNKMLTYSSPIPFREKGIRQSSSGENKEYEFMKKPTGETIAAQRVDYR